MFGGDCTHLTVMVSECLLILDVFLNVFVIEHRVE
jgi:hypothetical protein